jgi:hypothetical protein
MWGGRATQRHGHLEPQISAPPGRDTAFRLRARPAAGGGRARRPRWTPRRAGPVSDRSQDPRAPRQVAAGGRCRRRRAAAPRRQRAAGAGRGERGGVRAPARGQPSPGTGPRRPPRRRRGPAPAHRRQRAPLQPQERDAARGRSRRSVARARPRRIRVGARQRGRRAPAGATPPPGTALPAGSTDALVFTSPPTRLKRSQVLISPRRPSRVGPDTRELPRLPTTRA